MRTGLKKRKKRLKGRMQSLKKYRKPDNATTFAILCEESCRVTQQEGLSHHLKMPIGTTMKRRFMWMLWRVSHSLVLATNTIQGLVGRALIEPINPSLCNRKTDYKLLYPRTEVRSKYDSHLGHVFDDGLKKRQENDMYEFCSTSIYPPWLIWKKGYGEYIDRVKP